MWIWVFRAAMAGTVIAILWWQGDDPDRPEDEQR